MPAPPRPSAAAAAAASSSAPEVTAKDQELINEFNRLHQRREELSAAARARAADESDAADAVEEVTTAYLVASDDEDGDEGEGGSGGPPVRFVVGECFLHAPSEDAATARAESCLEEAKREASKASAEEKEATERMGQLKESLYAKFGDSINLEA